jgi:tripartite-type tricarboxylate transporter receptor subunit TctC
MPDASAGVRSQEQFGNLFPGETMSKLLHRATAALLGAVLSMSALAQDAYPSKPVRILVPYAAGGVADALPRIVGEKLAQTWKQPVIVDNRPGASGNIGMDEGSRTPPDGQTLVLAPAGNLTVTPLLFRHLRFDVAKDFTPVTVLASSPNVLVVHPSVPVKTLKQLIAYAKQNPGKLNFASPGEGSGAHLAGELLNIDADIKTEHIPYKGIAPAVNDLLGGNVQMMFAGISTVLQQIKAGKLVAIGIASPQRSPQLPDVPTISESGLPGFDVTSWYGIVVRSGTPPAIVQRLQRDIATALKNDDVLAKLAGLGLDPVGNTPEAFDTMIKAETRKWTDIVRRANIKPQD